MKGVGVTCHLRKQHVAPIIKVKNTVINMCRGVFDSVAYYFTKLTTVKRDVSKKDQVLLRATAIRAAGTPKARGKHLC